MGFSVSAASAILFISFAVVFGIVFGAMGNYQYTISDAQQSQMQRLQEEKETQVSITTVDTDNTTVDVANVGSVTLNAQDVDMLVNGTMVEISNITVLGHPGSNIWSPGEIIRMHVSSNLTDARIKVIVENGIAAYR